MRAYMESKGTIGRVLAVDWGEKRIGLAISDETQTLAKPLSVIRAKSRIENAEIISKIAEENHCVTIVIGVSYDSNGNLSPSGRRGDRLAHAMRSISNAKIFTIDEYRSTQNAQQHQITLATSRKKRRGHLDSKAAAVFLQAYLNTEFENE